MRRPGNAAGSCVRNSTIAETIITKPMSGPHLTCAEISVKHYLMFDRKKMRLRTVFSV